MGRFFQSFYFKISAILLLLLISMTGLQALLLRNFFQKFGSEAEQLLNLDLADTFAAELLPLITPTIDYPALQDKLFRLSTLFPRYRIYIVDTDGTLRYYVAEKQELKRKKISVGPIERLLVTDSRPTLPLFGETPQGKEPYATFSAARITFGNEPGYLYVVLSNERNETVASVLQGSYLLKNSAAGIALTVIVAAWIGLILFSRLTRRLRTMTDIVLKFDAGDFSQRIDHGAPDELGHLAKSFNRMAATIVSNIEQLKATDKQRRDLVASISHDLRSPITSIRGYLEEVQELPEPVNWSAVKPAISVAYNNVRNLETLVSELFEYSKLEAKDIKPDLTPCSLSALCEWVGLKFEPVAEQYGVELHTKASPSLPAVLADKVMLERALSNLVENAIRYNRTGGAVTLSATEVGSQVQLTVSDNGVGICDEDLPRIFESFFRVDRARSKDVPGTGLGLAIVKKIVEAHGAHIAVKSALGEGTEFSFLLNTVPTTTTPVNERL